MNTQSFGMIIIPILELSFGSLGKKCHFDELVMYVSRLLNNVEHNYGTIWRKTLAMVFALHKFKHYLLGSKFVFYVDHMALVYLVNKP
jgi:hypothetical protein